MKKMMMALAALCVAGAASAATLKWTYDSASDNSAPNRLYGDSDCELGATLPDNLYVSITLGGTGFDTLSDGDNALVLLGQWNGGDTKLSVNKDADSGALTLTTTGSTGLTAVDGADTAIKSGDVITVAYNKDGSGYDIEIYIGDTLIATRDNSNASGLSFITYRNSDYDAVDNLISSATVYEGIAPVPEPTALALLALGVAGLALRRKAA